jgi:uncharacterized membrane protein (UPF0127 family)
VFTLRRGMFWHQAARCVASVIFCVGVLANGSSIPANAARCTFTNDVLSAESLGKVQILAPNAAMWLDVAYSEPQRARGLMYRTHLAQHHGMVFLYDREDERHFWMKNTLVPLDMVFLHADGTVSAVDLNVPPDTTHGEAPPIYSAQGCAVIELPAGEAARDGIAAGRRLRVTRNR